MVPMEIKLAINVFKFENFSEMWCCFVQRSDSVSNWGLWIIKESEMIGNLDCPFPIPALLGLYYGSVTTENLGQMWAKRHDDFCWSILNNWNCIEYTVLLKSLNISMINRALKFSVQEHPPLLSNTEMKNVQLAFFV